MVFENKAQRYVSRGSILKVAFTVNNVLYKNTHEDRYKWSDEDLKFLTAIFEVHDDVTVRNLLLRKLFFYLCNLLQFYTDHQSIIMLILRKFNLNSTIRYKLIRAFLLLG